MSETSSTWHKIADGLPERSGQYIVFAATADSKKRRVLAARYFIIPFAGTCEEGWTHQVTHWHELPDDPTEE